MNTEGNPGDKPNMPNRTHDDVQNVDRTDTNQDSLLDQLSLANLTEDDTESLLEEAYKLNKRLKSQLKQQEKSENEKKKHCEKQNPRPRGSRLPPIHSAPGRLVTKSQMQSIYTPNSTISFDSRNTKYSDEKRLMPKTEYAHGKSHNSATKRPEWDDRFTSN